MFICTENENKVQSFVVYTCFISTFTIKCFTKQARIFPYKTVIKSFV